MCNTLQIALPSQRSLKYDVLQTALQFNAVCNVYYKLRNYYKLQRNMRIARSPYS